MRLRGKAVPLLFATLAILAVVTASALAEGEGKTRVRAGSAAADVLRGGDDADRMFGFGGSDRIYGYGGRDSLVGGAGNDLLMAGAGSDRIDARDGRRDVVYCGAGDDVVSRDANDDLKRDCERSTRGALALGTSPTPSANAVKDARPKARRAHAPQRQATIVISIGGSGKVRSVPARIDCPPRCRGRFPVGTRMRLVATPNAARSRPAWAGVCRRATQTCTLLVRSSMWIRANFVGMASPPPSTPPPPAPPPSPPSGQVVIRVDESFECNGRVNLDLVRITMRTRVDDALRLDQNCTGRIGRLEIDTWTADGIKVQNRGTVAHDLVIESGYVKCHAIAGDYHQDGVQAMGGTRITFRNLAIDCLGNSNFFLARGGSGAVTPTDIVCDGCIFGPNSGQTLFWGSSIRSGALNTRICEGRFRALRVERDPVERIDRNNTILPRGHPSCANVTGR